MGFKEITKGVLKLLPYWKKLVIMFTPLVLLPLVVLGKGTEAKAGYVVALMAVYWMTEALPLPVTALLPVVLFPLLGVMDTSAITTAYMKETIMLFMGGLMLASSIEYCNLHRRIALRVLLTIGAGPRWLMLGFMIISSGLSMWISNSATTVMVVPIVEAVFEELFKREEENQNDDGAFSPNDGHSKSVGLDLGPSQTTITSKTSMQQLSHDSRNENYPTTLKQNDLQQLRKCTLLSVAYSSNLGGTGTIIGCGANMIMIGLFRDLYGNDTGLNFASWMAFNIPGMIINVLLAWIWLQFLFIGFKRTDYDKDQEALVKEVIRRKYNQLGPMTFHEASVLGLFCLCVLLWFFRNPQFITGWGDILNTVKVGDSTVVMLILVLLFILPANKPSFLCSNSERRGQQTADEALLSWKYIQDQLPWGIVLLLGSGFALSEATKVSGLSKWFGQQLIGLQVLPPFAIMLIASIATAGITEVVQNAATANIFLPILAQMAVSIQMNPIYLVLPATLTCSYAFMLPVGSVPNAIVYDVAKMKTIEMVKCGIVMNLVSITVTCLLMITYGNFLFGLDQFPVWAMALNSTNVPT